MSAAAMIGLTGPIGAGKSTVAAVLASLGATVLDADRIVRDLQVPGASGYIRIVESWGDAVLAPDGTLDRTRLANTVFRDPGKLRWLESVMHPLVVEHVLGTREGLDANKILVVEAIKLLESKIRRDYDEIWVVTAPRTELIKRLRARGLSQAESEGRLANQPGDAEFRAAATVVIENDGGIRRMREQVKRQWRLLKERLVLAI